MRKRFNDGDNPTVQAAEAAAEVGASSIAPSSRCWLWFKRGCLALCMIYIAMPLMLRLYPGLMTHLMYSHKVPFFVDLSQPAALSLNHTTNLYLTPEEGVSLGVWHTVPESQWKEAQGKDFLWYQNSLGGGSPIVIYLHASGGTRAASHRVGITNVLSAAGYHVLALDYRGFGDSSGDPTEAGLTTDSLHLYQWVKAHSGDSLVLIWGHSLGSGVATNAAVKLVEQGVVVDGVILQGAFTNGRQACAFAFSQYYWKFPGFDYFFLDTMTEQNIIFPNDENLKKIRSPLLVLHAEDDHIIPVHMAEQLYSIARSNPDVQDRVKMVNFRGSLGYKHNGLYKDPHLPDIIRQFTLSLDP